MPDALATEFLAPILIALDCMPPNLSTANEGEQLKLDEYSLRRHLKRDSLQVNFYQHKCKNPNVQKLNNKDLWQRLSGCSSYLQVLADLVHVFMVVLENMETSVISPSMESLFVNVSMKFKLLLDENAVQEHSKELLEDLKYCLRLLEKQNDSDLLSFVCGEASSEEIRDLKKTSAGETF